METEERSAQRGAIDAFWREFCAGEAVLDPSTPYSFWYFCDNRECANSLYQLVLDGPKRATARLFSPDDPEPPYEGEYSVVTDFDGEPKCIIRVTEVKTLPFDQVDEKFAFDEGEGDRTLEYWRDAHWRFFSRWCASVGKEPALDMPVVCQRFTLLYPRSKIPTQ